MPDVPRKRAPGPVCAPGGPEEVRILQLHAGGASPHTIAAALNRSGLRTAAGVRWHATSVTDVIGARQSRASV